MRDVVTYFEDLSWVDPSKSNKDLVEKWRTSWSKRGWNPIVLGVKDSIKNNVYGQIDLENRESVFHSCNPVTQKPFSYESYFYNLSCYRRLLAYSQYVKTHGATLISDFDVINYGWTPDFMEGVAEDSIFAGERCALFLGKRGASKMDDALISFYKKGSPIVVTRGHENLKYPHDSSFDIDVMVKYTMHDFNLLKTQKHKACNFDAHPYYVSNVQLVNKNILNSIPLIHFDHGCYHVKSIRSGMSRAEIVDFVRPI